MSEGARTRAAAAAQQLSAVLRARKQWRRAGVGALVGAVVGAVLAGLLAWGDPGLKLLIERGELVLLDWRMAHFADPAAVSPDLKVVTISDTTITWLRKNFHTGWPVGRDTEAAFLDALAATHPKAIVLDVVFSDAKEHSEDMGHSEYAAGNVVIAVYAPLLDEQGGPDQEAPWSAEELASITGAFPPLVPLLKSRSLPVVGVAPEYGRNTRARERRMPVLIYPEKSVLAGARAVGLASIANLQDSDGGLRRFDPVVSVHGEAVAMLPVAALATAEAATDAKPAWDGELPPPRPPLPSITLGRASAQVAGVSIPLRRDGTAWIRWEGNWTEAPLRTTHTMAAEKVFDNLDELALGQPMKKKLNPKDELHPEDLTGKIVLVGFTGQGEGEDKVATPFGFQPGVYMHAAVLDTLLRRAFLAPVPKVIELLLVFLIPALVGAAVLGLPQFRWQVAGGPVLLAFSLLGPGLTAEAAYVLGAFAAFRQGWVVDMIHAEIAMVITTALTAAFAWFFIRRDMKEEERKKDQVQGVLARSVGREIALDMIGRDERGEFKLGGEQRVMTFYFSDIAGFTTIAEKLPPQELIAVLNDYLARVSELFLERFDGQIDKYIGDAIMAFWGAPDPVQGAPAKACLAALEAIRTMDEFSAELVRRGLPALRTRIGINTGPAVVGLVGHPQKMSYTSLGDTVNLASRLEGANKAYGTTAIIGPLTRQEAGEAILARELDLVKVQGKNIPVRIFELMGRADDAMPQKREIKRRYEAALERFRRREFAPARTEFLALLAEFGDPPSRKLAANCEDMIQNPPPADWDGSNQLHEK